MTIRVQLWKVLACHAKMRCEKCLEVVVCCSHFQVLLINSFPIENVLLFAECNDSSGFKIPIFKSAKVHLFKIACLFWDRVARGAAMKRKQVPFDSITQCIFTSTLTLSYYHSWDSGCAIE